MMMGPKTLYMAAMPNVTTSHSLSYPQSLVNTTPDCHQVALTEQQRTRSSTVCCADLTLMNSAISVENQLCVQYNVLSGWTNNTSPGNRMVDGLYGSAPNIVEYSSQFSQCSTINAFGSSQNIVGLPSGLSITSSNSQELLSGNINKNCFKEELQTSSPFLDIPQVATSRNSSENSTRFRSYSMSAMDARNPHHKQTSCNAESNERINYISGSADALLLSQQQEQAPQLSNNMLGTSSEIWFSKQSQSYSVVQMDAVARSCSPVKYVGAGGNVDDMQCLQCVWIESGDRCPWCQTCRQDAR